MESEKAVNFSASLIRTISGASTGNIAGAETDAASLPHFVKAIATRSNALNLTNFICGEFIPKATLSWALL